MQHPAPSTRKPKVHDPSNPDRNSHPSKANDSCAIFQTLLSSHRRAMGTAVDLSSCFDAMTNDSAVAMSATWRECLDGAFKAVECVTLPSHHHFKRLVVFVSADFALCHDGLRFKHDAVLVATPAVVPRRRDARCVGASPDLPATRCPPGDVSDRGPADDESASLP